MVGVAKAADPASGDNNAADKTNESSE
jgi:hypothetical protein